MASRHSVSSLFRARLPRPPMSRGPSLANPQKAQRAHPRWEWAGVEVHLLTPAYLPPPPPLRTRVWSMMTLRSGQASLLQPR